LALLETLKRIALRPFDRSDHSLEGERRVENPDALAATGGRQGEQTSTMPVHAAPPGYVKPDDGRPRH
jgi:hypothetical protein